MTVYMAFIIGSYCDIGLCDVVRMAAFLSKVDPKQNMQPGTFGAHIRWLTRPSGLFCIKKIARQGTPELAVAKQTGASKTAAVCFSINATLFCPFPQLAVRNRKQSECRKYEGEGELSRQIRHKKENAYFSLSQTHPILKNARRINFCDSTFGLFKKSTSDAAQGVELVVF